MVNTKVGARELYREMTHLPPEQYESPPPPIPAHPAAQQVKGGKGQGGAAKPHDPTDYVAGFGGGFLNPESVEGLSDEEREEAAGENLEASASPAPGEREDATGEDF